MTSRSLCVARGCAARGRHMPGGECDADQCRGCLPRRAADGLALCPLHVDVLGEDACTAARLYRALADRLTSTGLPGEKTSGTRDPGLKINLAALGARIVIRHTLVAWTKLIAEERGLRMPVADDGRDVPVDVGALGTFVSLHSTWLAALPGTLPADACEELRDVVHTAHRIAYPSGTRIFDVAPCPTPDCPGTLRAVLRRADALLPAAVVCSLDDGHTWTADRWLMLGRQIRGIV